MSEVRVYFNPLDASSLELHQVKPGTTVEQFILDNYPDGFGGIWRTFVGSDPLGIEDHDRQIEPDERVTILVMPGAAAAAAVWSYIAPYLVQAAISAAIGLVIGLIFRPSSPKGTNYGDESPVYSIGATQNRARPNEPIASHYGKVVFPPDYAAAPYVHFHGGSNDMFVDELLCLGQGNYVLDEILIGETPVSTMEWGTAKYWLYGPEDHNSQLGIIEADVWSKVEESEAPIPFRENVFTSPEVENWEFAHDTGEVVTTWAAISGTAVARGIYAPTGEELPGRIHSVPDTIEVKPGDTLELQNTTSNNVSFEVDAVVPGDPGTITIFERYKDDIISSESPLNGAAEYRRNTVANDLKAGPFRAQKEGQEVDSIDCDILFPGGLYRVSSSGNIRKRAVDMQLTFQQIDPDTGAAIGAPVVVNKTYEDNQRKAIRDTVHSGPLAPGSYEVTVERLTPIDDDANKNDTVVWAGLKGNVAHDTTKEAYGPVTLLALRMKATNGLGQAARTRVRVKARRVLANGESDNPITIVKDIWTNTDYGMARDLAELDTGTLDLLEAEWDTESGPSFNGSFDQPNTGLEAMQSVVGLAAAKVVQDNGLTTVVVDKVQPVRTAMFSTANVLRDSFSIDYTFDSEGDFDGVRCEYRNPETFDAEFATYPEDATNPRDENAFGCTNGEYALKFARYLWQAHKYRRKLLRHQTELEGLIPRFGDRIGTSHTMPNWGQSGVIVERLEYNKFRVDQPLKWDAGRHYIILREIDGSPSEPELVTMGETSDIVVFENLPPVTVETPEDREPTSYAFGSEYQLMKDFIVTKISPRGDSQIEIEGQVYDERIQSGGPDHLGG